jgi:hypothetical protein
MRTLVQRLKRWWNTPVEFYGVDRPEPQAGPWHGLLLFVILLMVLGLLWLIRYLPERTYLVHDWPPETRSRVAQVARSSGGLTLDPLVGGMRLEGQRRGPPSATDPRYRVATAAKRLLVGDEVTGDPVKFP